MFLERFSDVRVGVCGCCLFLFTYRFKSFFVLHDSFRSLFCRGWRCVRLRLLLFVQVWLAGARMELAAGNCSHAQRLLNRAFQARKIAESYLMHVRILIRIGVSRQRAFDKSGVCFQFGACFPD